MVFTFSDLSLFVFHIGKHEISHADFIVEWTIDEVERHIKYLFHVFLDLLIQKLSIIFIHSLFFIVFEAKVHFRYHFQIFSSYSKDLFIDVLVYFFPSLSICFLFPFQLDIIDAVF